MMRVCVLGLLSAAALGKVQDITGRDTAALSAVLRREDTVSLLFMYDSTHEAGSLNYKHLKEAEDSLSLYADLYAVDIAEEASAYLARAYSLDRATGFLSVIFGPSLATVRDSAEQAGRPGGVKKPAPFNGPVTHMKAALQVKTPEPRGLKKLKAKAPEDVNEHLAAEGQTLVVFTEDKSKVSAVLKSVSMRVGAVVAKQLLVQIDEKQKKAFGVKKLPALTLYEADGSKQVFNGKVEHAALAEFFKLPTAEAVAEEKIAQDATEFKLLAKKLAAPVTHVKTHEDWEAEVLDPAIGLVLVAFLDPDQDNDSMLKLLKVMATSKTSIRSVVWASTHQTYKLMEHFRVEPGSLVFVTAKHDKYVVFTGAQTQKALTKFASKEIMKAQSRALGTPPKFDS